VGRRRSPFNRLRSIEGPVPKISGTSQGPFRRAPNLSYWRELPIPHGGRLPRSMDSRQTELLCVSGDAACAALSPGGGRDTCRTAVDVEVSNMKVEGVQVRRRGVQSQACQGA
jgi:hypothetical protein